MRVLVVEDDIAVAQSVRDYIDRAGFTVDLTHDGKQAWLLGDTEEYNAIILDLGLPGRDGLTVLRDWRAGGRKVPVILLSARGSWIERVEGIDAGADDYLPKPFQLEELLSRLHAVLRRTAGHASNLKILGNLVVDLRRKTVTVNGSFVDLTPLEFRLLSTFIQRPNDVIAFSDLLDQLYGYNHDKDINALEAVLTRLRRKIGPELVGTRRGQGYFFKSSE
jgi:two-component system, OmpR family, response regulator